MKNHFDSKTLSFPFKIIYFIFYCALELLPLPNALSELMTCFRLEAE